MFDWIVQQVNSAMAKLAANLRQEKVLCTGVLDIFGFEIFQVIWLMLEKRL
jgi:myosin heavy subunit